MTVSFLASVSVPKESRVSFRFDPNALNRALLVKALAAKISAESFCSAILCGVNCGRKERNRTRQNYKEETEIYNKNSAVNHINILEICYYPIWSEHMGIAFQMCCFFVSGCALYIHFFVFAIICFPSSRKRTQPFFIHKVEQKNRQYGDERRERKRRRWRSRRTWITIKLSWPK